MAREEWAGRAGATGSAGATDRAGWAEWGPQWGLSACGASPP